MSTENLKIRLPEEAISEFEAVERSDWSEGIGLDQLLAWINWVAERFRPDEIGKSSRSSKELSPRSFRHYQTLGCIDRPERDGRVAVYRFRHYLQALLLRKLIWERVPSVQITHLMKGRSNDELKHLLFEGIEFVPASEATGNPGRTLKDPERWTRTELIPGLEVHIRDSLASLSTEQIATAVTRMTQLLKGH